MRKGKQISNRTGRCPRVVSDIYKHIAVDRSVIAELNGSGEIVIRGCKRICKYTPQQISLKLATGRINVCGNGLTCYSFSGTDVGIRGRIKCVFFTDDKKGGREK